MKRLLPLIIFVFLNSIVSAQHQVFELMERTDLSIYQVESLANRYFDTTGTGRGTGYKQFQRWLYERKFHVDENGFYIHPQIEWNRYLQARGTMGELTTAGNWSPMGPSGWTYSSGWNPGTGRISALAIHPANESIIYVGSPGGGLWKTTNAGANWTALTDNNSTWMSVFALTIDPLNQNIVYMGTSTSLLLKSTDAGASWSPTGAGPTGTIRKVLIHPTTTNFVFACASNGIFRSVNAGVSWTQVHNVSKEDIEFKPDDPNIMYASGNNVVRSVDMGLNWTTLGSTEGITNTGRTLVAVSPIDPQVVYAVQASGSLFGRMYRSTNAGQSFVTTVVGNPGSGTNYFGYDANGTGTTGQATYDMALDVSPTNANDVYIAGIICWRSINGGNSFTPQTVWSYPNTTGYNHADVHGLFWINNTIYSISDGGIYKSIDHGDNWTDLSTGLNIRQFYRIALSQTNPNVITGGAQDNGSAARQNGGNWVDWLGADGMEGLVSPTDHLRIWGTSQNGNIYRSINGGNSYSGLPRPSPGQWVTPLAIHPSNESILYGGWTGVYKSVNGGTSWTNISVGSITQTLADLTLAPSNPNYIYASNGANLWVTTNDGASWTLRSAPSTINDIAVDPADPNKIWIACNSTTNRILVSTNAGATFTNVSQNLPAIVARTIVVDDNSPRGLYVGMNIGVYYKQETASSWTDYSDNLPMVAINELEIQKISQKIRVATYGRGVWESPLANAAPGFSFTIPGATNSPCPPQASLSSNLGTIQTGGFTNPITLSAIAGIPAGTTVNFSQNPVSPGNSSSVILNNTSGLTPGTYTITIRGSATSAPDQTRDVSFIINPGAGPVINSVTGSQTVCAGSNINFAVNATDAISYQWQVSLDACATWVNLANGAPYSGVTTATLNINPVIAGMNNNRYRVLINGQCGVTTSPTCVMLNIAAAPAITTQPQGATLCSAGSNQFCVVATGTGLTYQWESNPVGCEGPWTAIPGATSACYTATATVNTWYRCRITNTCGGVVFSDCVSLTLNPVQVTTHPANSSLCAGSATSFTVAGAGAGLTYQWQVNTGTGFVNITAGAPYSGINSATLNIASTTVSMNGFQYRCQLSNAVCSAFSNAALLTVHALPTIGLSASASLTSLLPGQTSILTASPSASSGGTIQTSWYFNGTQFINASNNYSVNISNLGDYQVRIQETWADGSVCSNQSSLVKIDASPSQKLFIFPSPNDGKFFVSYYNSTGVSTSRTVIVYDAKGAMVIKKKFNIAGPYTLMDVNIISQQKGVYLVVVTDESGNKIGEGKVLVH